MITFEACQIIWRCTRVFLAISINHNWQGAAAAAAAALIWDIITDWSVVATGNSKIRNLLFKKRNTQTDDAMFSTIETVSVRQKKSLTSKPSLTFSPLTKFINFRFICWRSVDVCPLNQAHNFPEQWTSVWPLAFWPFLLALPPAWPPQFSQDNRLRLQCSTRLLRWFPEW